MWWGLGRALVWAAAPGLLAPMLLQPSGFLSLPSVLQALKEALTRFTVALGSSQVTY